MATERLFAIAPVAETERRDLLEVLEDRYGMRSHLDEPHDGVVERVELVGGNPVLLVVPGADHVPLVAAKKIGAHLEAGHEPRA